MHNLNSMVKKKKKSAASETPAGESKPETNGTKRKAENEPQRSDVTGSADKRTKVE